MTLAPGAPVGRSRMLAALGALRPFDRLTVVPVCAEGRLRSGRAYPSATEVSVS